MARVLQCGEVAEDVEQIATVAECVDHRGVVRGCVLTGEAVFDEVLEALGLGVVRPGLAVDETEETFTGRAEEVVTTVVRRVVEGGDERGPLEHGGEGLSCVGAQIHDRLAGIEALDEQHVDPRFVELPCGRRRCNMDPERAVVRIGVVDDVKGAIAGCDDRRVVDDRRSGDADERAVARTCNRTGREAVEREAIRPSYRGARRAEVGCAREVNGRRTEGIGGRGWRVERNFLHAVGATDREVRELRREVDAEVFRQAGIRSVQQDVPDLLAVCRPGIERKADRFLAQVDLDRAFLRELGPREQPGELTEAVIRIGVAGGGGSAGEADCRGRGEQGEGGDEHAVLHAHPAEWTVHF